MMKVVLISAALAMGMTSVASAQNLSMHHSHAYMMRHHMKKNRVLANGRCNGVSYGTGGRSCGTATGGPVGGLGSRN